MLTGDVNFSLGVGNTKTLSYRVLPENATNQNVSWSSSNPKVAIVASEGVVHAIGIGNTTITITTKSGNKIDTCSVQVTGYIPVTGMELKETILFLKQGSTKPLTPTVYPSNATNQKITWISSNSLAATVTGGTVSGFGPGTATITATTEDGGFEATCAVTVVLDVPVIDDTIEMVWINPGTFMMGSPYDEPESYDDETLHPVTLTEGFYMGKYPVTQGQYFEIMEVNSSYYPQSWHEYRDRKLEFPVERINWFDAIVFCNKLSMKEGLSPAYTIYKKNAPAADDGNPNYWADTPGNWSTNPGEWGDIPYGTSGGYTRWSHIRVVAGSSGYRLPTEAQWEYACRAGTTTPFNTGNSITPNQANCNGRYPYNSPFDPGGVSLGQTVPVGMFAPNAWELYDMHGNVQEWCWDWYGSYSRPGMTNTNPTGPDTGDEKIIRGGLFYSQCTTLRSAYRDALSPGLITHRNDEIGFRVVLPFSASIK
jgi:formylglycine-generating enzyme required for sulfatase activity